jgi:hypothetical protein
VFGFTVKVPFGGRLVPEPPPAILPVMLTELAPEVNHVRTTGLPAIVENSGLEVNDRILTPVPTVTVVLATTSPWPLRAVKVYVVVAAGVTVAQADGATVPSPGAMEMVVAFSTTQQSWELAPASMVAGLAVNDTILASWPLLTVTTTEALTDLPSLDVAVRVYVVVCVGETDVLPLNARVPLTPVIVTVAAPSVVQDNIEDSPDMMLVGTASYRMILGSPAAGGLTVTVTVAVCVARPVAVAVRV